MIRHTLFFFSLLLLIGLPSGPLLISRSVAIAQTRNEAGRALPTQPSDAQTPAAAVAGLNPFRSLTVAGDYVASGVGLRDVSQGNITLLGIPAGASVIESYLYWGMLDNGESPSLKNINFNGTPLVGTLVGRGLDTNWGRSDSFAYRANVTSLVAGNGAYALTGVASGGAILAQGASLVAIYQRAGDPNRNIVLLDGDSVYKAFDDSITTTIAGFQATAPISAKTTFIVGDGQSQNGETVLFTGGAGTAVLPNIFDESDGLLWDTDTFIVSSQINPGDTSATASIPPFSSDALMWVGQVFSVTTSPPFDMCIQDESNGAILQINTITGNYQFTNCGGLIIGGTGSITRRGGVIRLQGNGPDRRVLATIDTNSRRATASVQLMSIGRVFSITDRNITNNTCSC